MLESERQKAKRLRRVLASGELLSAKLASWLELYEKGIALGCKSMAEVESGVSSGSPLPPQGAGAGGAPTSSLPPLSVDLPGEVAKPVKPGSAPTAVVKPGEKRVAPRDPATGHVIATPMGTTASGLLEKYIIDQNKWLKDNGGTPYPEPLIAISCFSMQQVVDYYISPFMAGEMALHALNAATPIAWVWWFRRKRESGLDTKMEEAESLASKPKPIRSVAEKDEAIKTEIADKKARDTSTILPQTYKEMQEATSAIMGGKGGLK